MGAVLVKDNIIIGKGFHSAFGAPHAEVEAIGDAQKKGFSVQGSSLYVTLEPCVHFGKTPPCTELILNSGISEVFIGMTDPDPKVKGLGLNILKENKIKVEVGVLEKECQKLNQFYIKHRETGLPYVILKVAATLDGKIADSHGGSRWITGDGARCYVHKIRSRMDAILVGINTVIKDNPQLTVRLPGVSAKPLRIVLDSHLRIPLDSKILNDASVSRTMIIMSSCHSGKSGDLSSKIDEIRKKGAQVLPSASCHSRDLKIALKPLLQSLSKDGVMSLMVEGGAETNASFLKEGLVDQIDYFFAPRILGAEGLNSIASLGIDNIQKALSFKDYKFERVGNDLLFEGTL